jgi:N-acetylglutamate synthase-like GNAT family acetyltransferase
MNFKQYYLESENLPFSDEDFAEKHHQKNINGARLLYQVSGDLIDLASLRVSGKKRNQGLALAAMKALVAEADARKLRIKLLASPLDKRTNLNRLGNFYLNLGFRIIGRGNPLGHAIMERLPTSS